MKNTLLTLTTTLALATTVGFADIQPKDGTWKAIITESDIKGCSPMMRSMIEKQSKNAKTQPMTFEKPFHPNSMYKEADHVMKWKKVDDNLWEASLKQSDNENTMGMKLKMIVDIKSETLMEMKSSSDMSLPKEMAKMMGGSTECKSDIIATYNFVK